MCDPSPEPAMKVWIVMEGNGDPVFMGNGNIMEIFEDIGDAEQWLATGALNEDNLHFEFGKMYDVDQCDEISKWVLQENGDWTNGTHWISIFMWEVIKTGDPAKGVNIKGGE